MFFLVKNKNLIGITTFCKTKRRFDIINRFFENLLDINKNIFSKYDLYVADDKSSYLPFYSLLDNLETKGFKIIRGDNNMGISVNSNRLFKIFEENRYSHMFKLEDDNEFLQDGIFEIYSMLMNGGSQKHFSYRSERYFKLEFNETYYLDLYPDVKLDVKNKKIESGYEHYVKYGKKEKRKTADSNIAGTINGFTIRSHNSTNGVLLCLTKEVFNKIGGFRVAPEKWGYEHLDFSRRCKKAGLCDLFCDFDESNKYLEVIDDSTDEFSNFTNKEKIEMGNINNKWFEEHNSQTCFFLVC